MAEVNDTCVKRTEAFGMGTSSELHLHPHHLSAQLLFEKEVGKHSCYMSFSITCNYRTLKRKVSVLKFYFSDASRNWKALASISLVIITAKASHQNERMTTEQSSRCLEEKQKLHNGGICVSTSRQELYASVIRGGGLWTSNI